MSDTPETWEPWDEYDQELTYPKEILGLRLVRTCIACPEQYDVYEGDTQVAYFRLRHGKFTVECPDVRGELVYSANPEGDGIFCEHEREKYLTEAVQAVLKYLHWGNK